jgi:hypothetical protein
MVQIYALINPSNLIVNLVEWDGVTAYNVSPNTLVLATGQPNAQIGGTYISGVFTAPSAPAPAQGIIYQNSPTSGSTLALPNAPQPQAKLYAYLQPAGTLAALTLTLPPSPQDGDQLTLLSTHAITALTLTGTLLNFSSPFTLGAGVSQIATYSAQLAGWFHL